MIQIAPDMAEIQMVQARQAQQQAPAQGIASQWSAAQQGMPASPLSTIAGGAPMGGGLGGGMAAGAAAMAPTMSRSRSVRPDQGMDDDDFNWSGAGKGAAMYGMQGAAIGAKFGGGYGAAIGGAIGVIGGGLAGGLSDD